MVILLPSEVPGIYGLKSAAALSPRIFSFSVNYNASKIYVVNLAQ